MAIKINGVNYRWKQESRTTGRAGIGSAPAKYRSWNLRPTVGDGPMLGWVEHTHNLPYTHSPTEPPAWKVYLRLTLLDGSRYEGYLKYREPDAGELGDAGTEVLEKAKAYLLAVIKTKLTPPAPKPTEGA